MSGILSRSGARLAIHAAPTPDPQNRTHGATATRWPTVGLITIWYRAGRSIERFLGDLREQQYPSLAPVFVIHSLTAEDMQRLRRGAPEATVIDPGENLGSAAGWNVGMRWLLERKVDYVSIWNVDVHLEPTAVRRLVEVMERDPSLGASQPLLLYSHDPGRVQMYGGSVDLSTGRARHDYNKRSDLTQLPPLRDAEYLDGGTMLARADVLERVGGFDERFFMYAEDCDLSRRIQAAGYRTVAVRDARAWHRHHEDIGSLPGPYQVFYETRNRFYLVRKHRGRTAWLRMAARSLTDVPRHVRYYAQLGQPELARAYVMGTASGIAGLMGKRGWVE